MAHGNWKLAGDPGPGRVIRACTRSHHPFGINIKNHPERELVDGGEVSDAGPLPFWTRAITMHADGSCPPTFVAPMMPSALKECSA
jgi:hypothetical protein